MTRKRAALITAIAVFIAIFLALIVLPAKAAGFDLPDTETIKNFIPAPIKEFIDSASQIGGGISVISEKAERLTAGLDWQTPAKIYDKADSWFSETTGLSIKDALLGIGNAIVWFLELILSIFKRLLSLAE